MGISQTAQVSMSDEIPENPTFLSSEFRYTNAIPGRFMACWPRSVARFARERAFRDGFELKKAGAKILVGFRRKLACE